MNSSLDRRRFLGAAAASLGLSAISLAEPNLAQAIEPIARQSGPNFKFSLAAYSYRELFKGKKFVDKPFTLEEFVDDCAAMQLQGTELTSYYFPTPVTPDYLRQIRRRAFLLGLDVSGTAVSNDFSMPAGEARDKQLANVKQWVDNAEILGAPVIRVFSGGNPRSGTVNESIKNVIEGLEQSCEYAGKHGVTLALENHGGLCSTSEMMLSIVKAVKSPWFGVNLDSGNFHGADPYGDLVKIAPYAVNAQIKVRVTDAAHKNEPSDYKRLAKIMRDAGYRGYIVLEYEQNDDPRKACPAAMAQIREAFA